MELQTMKWQIFLKGMKAVLNVTIYLQHYAVEKIGRQTW